MAILKEHNKFRVGDAVVYPAHGVGRITAEETEVIAGTPMQLYVISFAEDKMTLRVPKSRASGAGLRHLSSAAEMDIALEILKGHPQAAAGVMWSKRAQEYEARINSGNPIEIAKVVRDLHCTDNLEERSYSARVFYEDALERLISEYAVSAAVDKEVARQKINEILSKEDVVEDE